MSLSNAERQKLYRQRKNGNTVTDVTDRNTVTSNTVTRIHKLEQVVSSLVLAVNALQREVGLIRKQQKFNTPDYNPESW